MKKKCNRILLCIMLCFSMSPAYAWALDYPDGVEGKAQESASDVSAGAQGEESAMAYRDEVLPEDLFNLDDNEEAEVPDGSAAPSEVGADSAGFASIFAVSPQSSPTGLFVLGNISSGQVLDVSSGSVASGANVQQYADNNSPAQRFRAEEAGDGYCYVINVNSGKALDVIQASKTPGANVWQYDRNGSDAQKWMFYDSGTGDGSYYIVSALSGNVRGDLRGALVLEVKGGSADSGANIQIGAFDGGEAQRFGVRSISRTVEDGLYEVHSGLVGEKGLDIAGGSSADGANLQLYTANKSAAQRFSIMYDEASGYYEISIVGSGKSLDVAGASAADGANAQQYARNGSAAQKWTIEPLGAGGYMIRSGCSGKVLDVQWGDMRDGANVWLYGANGSSAQSWLLVQAGSRAIDDGLYEVGSKLASNLVLDIWAASAVDHANVQIYASNGTGAQKFEAVFDASTGYYQLRNSNSGKMLDVAGAGTHDGSNVQQYGDNGSLAQKWAIDDAGDGRYTIRSACSGLALDVANGDARSGANVQTWTANGTAAQAWTFSSSKLIEEGIYEVQSALGTVLDAAQGGEVNTTNVQAYAANGSLAQKYKIGYVEDGYCKIESIKSGLVLDVVWGAGPNVHLYAFDASDAQLWKPVAAGGGCISFINKKTGQALDVEGASAASGANVQVYEPNGSSAQRWKLLQTEQFSEGFFTFASAVDSNMMLDIQYGSTDDGALLQLYESNGTAAQKFKVVSLGNGFCRIVCLGTGKSLDLKDSALDPSTGAGTVQQWTSGEGNVAQIWRISYAGDGLFGITSACGNGDSALSLSNGEAANGTPVGVLRNKGGQTQKFKMIETGSADYVQYRISLDQMVSYQRSNPYIDDLSDASIRAALDPDNAAGSYFYQFVDLRIWTGLTGGQLDAYIDTSGSTGVLHGKGSAFSAAARQYGLNEAYLVAHTCLESGWGGSLLAKGTEYDGRGYWYRGKDGNQYWADFPGYPAGTYYNLFGIGAYDSDPHKFGVQRAIEKGWNSVDAAISGSAQWIASNYVYRSVYAQPTLYEMKWDAAESNATLKYGPHQYATDIGWAKKIARLMSACYEKSGNANPDLRYVIPRYA